MKNKVKVPSKKKFEKGLQEKLTLQLAAPILLKSLEECLEWIEQRSTGIALDCKDSARVAIKMAKGEL